MTITSSTPAVNKEEETTESVRDFCFKFGNITKGSADLGLYWSPLTEENVLIADSDNVGMAGKAHYVLSEFGENSKVDYLDFYVDCDDSGDVLSKFKHIESIVAETKERNVDDDEDRETENTVPHFIVINGFDHLTKDHKHDPDRLGALDNLFWLLKHGSQGRIHVLLGVEDVLHVPSFVQSYIGLTLYTGRSNISSAEEKFGIVETYHPENHQGVVKSYIADTLFPVSRFFD